MKRKESSLESPEDEIVDEQAASESPSDESSSDEDTDLVDVDFEWFDPQLNVDFHGIKTLLRQLFAADSQMFNLSAVTDIILSQPLLGSTVKVDGNETDPYAFLTVLNVKELMGNPAIAELVAYLIGRATTSQDATVVNTLKSDEATVGLILTERLINIPSEVSPPMYKMLLEEIQWAVEEKEPYNFTHFLILSKTYQGIDSSVDEKDESTRKAKKQKKGKIAQEAAEMFFVHPEDEILQKHAISVNSFDYVKSVSDSESDSKAASQEMDLNVKGLSILIEAGKFEGAITEMKAFFGQT